jgi:N-acetylmuramidase/Peptidase_C39 like family
MTIFPVRPLRKTSLKLFSTAQSDTLPLGEVFDRAADEVLNIAAARPAADQHWEVLLVEPLTLDAVYPDDRIQPVNFSKCFVFGPHWEGIGDAYQAALAVDRQEETQEFIAESKQLPTKIIWDVPYLSQVDNALNPSGSCNRTAIAMALGFYGINGAPGSQFEDQMQIWLDGAGLIRHDPLHLKQMVEHYGAQDDFAFQSTKARLIKHLATTGPAVIHGYFTTSGHIITAVGYDADGLWVHDPWGEWFPTGYQINDAANPARGKLLHYSWGMIERLAMTDGQFWVHCISLPGFTLPSPLQVAYPGTAATQTHTAKGAGLSTVTARFDTLYKAQPVMGDRLKGDQKSKFAANTTIECVVSRAANGHLMLTFPDDRQIGGMDCVYVFAEHVNVSTPGGTQTGQPGADITIADIEAVAAEIGVDPIVLEAVLSVEAAGAGFLPSDRPKILFEAHWFSYFTDGIYDADYPGISSPVWNRALYKGGELEWDRLELAMGLNHDAAVDSASWGIAQIMGEHRTALGYGSAVNWVQAMSRSEAEQLRAMGKFIALHPAMIQALKRLDFAGFAYLYNGEGYEINQYDIQMADAYQQLINHR